MKPWLEVDQTKTPRGSVLSLSRRDDEWAILVDRKLLMSSRLHASEEALAQLGCERARLLPAPRILVGGLGMGFTLRAVLEQLPKRAEVVVAELLEAVVRWNRGPLAHLSGNALADRRVRVEITDVADIVRKSGAQFDAILLDVDNAPSAFTQPENAWLYEQEGLRACKAALRPEGTLAVWSAEPDPRFEKRLRQTDWVDPEARDVSGRQKGGPTHVVFVARVGKTPRHGRRS